MEKINVIWHVFIMVHFYLLVFQCDTAMRMSIVAGNIIIIRKGEHNMQLNTKFNK